MIRRVEAHRDEREVTLEVVVGEAHGLDQVAVVVDGDEVGDDLGVGLGREDGAAGLEALAQRQVVLDDAVDDDVHAVGGIEVRMSVLLVDAAVCRPARVTDADRRLVGDRRHGRAAAPLDRLVEAIEVAHRAHGIDRLTAHHRHAGRVVAAILELAQACQQELLRRPATDVSDDAAHGAQGSGRRGAARAPETGLDRRAGELRMAVAPHLDGRWPAL